MRSLCVPLILLCAAAFSADAQTPKLPKLNDPDLRLEVFATAPDIEAPTTVAAAPDGSVYIGCDPRDTRLNTDKPECSIIRYSSLGADKKRTVFATGLYSPAGSQWFGGWLYVIHDPFMSRFRDTDGDGIADVREDLVTNLGLPPYAGLNDHVVSGFVPGMDGFFYISVGDRGIYQARGKDGSTITLQGGGIVRVRPDGTALEIFSTGTRNHLSVLLDAEDNAFTRDNTDDGNGWWTRLTHHIEGGYYGYPYDYQKAPNYGVTQPSPQTLDAIKRNGGQVSSIQSSVFSKEKTDGAAAEAPPLNTEHRTLNTLFLPAMADFGGGSPTGGLCYLSDGLPEKYRGRLLFSEWGKGALHVTEVARDGATFRLVKDEPLIQSEKGADFRPMELCVAADGSLLITDWGWGGWKAPKTLGTVWHLSWPDAKPAPRLADESKASVEELLAALGHPDRAQRLRAQFALAGKGDAALADLDARVKDERAPDLQRIHALWTLETVFGTRPASEARGGGAAFAAAKSSKASVRAAAICALGQRHVQRLPLDPLIRLLRDPVPSVRLNAIFSLTRIIDRNRSGSFPPTLVTRVAAGVGDHMPIDGVPVACGGISRALQDADGWVRFTASSSLQKLGLQMTLSGEEPGKLLIAFLYPPISPITTGSTGGETGPQRDEAAWRILEGVFEPEVVSSFADLAGSAGIRELEFPLHRARAVAALGRIAYQPKPYDGHWWGTQPVKSPKPLPSVPWAGTVAALKALTAALADPHAGVRLAAARAFSGFLLPQGTAPVAAAGGPPAPGAKARLSSRVPGFSDGVPEFLRVPGDSATPSLDSATAWRDPGTPWRDPGAAPRDSGAARRNPGAAPRNPGAAPRSSAVPSGSSGTRWRSLAVAQITPVVEKAAPDTGDQKGAADLAAAVAEARAALRSRLTAETDPAVRRQLLEALGVQKDPQAMAVFKQIALDEKADPEFRDTAIAAVVNIGGDAARETIAQLAGAKVGGAATRKIIEAAGELRVIEAAPALIARLQDADAGNRESAVKALTKLGSKANARDGLIGALGDADAKVQTAAVEALGSLRDPAALPALIDFAKTKRAKRELIEALAKMPDAQSIPLLLDALRDANSGVRRPAISALKKLRAEAWPQIEANLASGRIPEEFAPEIRAAFESGVIAKWKMVGPFENVWEAVHPPEREMLAAFALVNGEGKVMNGGSAPPFTDHQSTFTSVLAKKYHNAEGKDVGWMDVTADAAEGRVDLEKVFKSSAMVCAYAFAEIDAPEAAEAKIFTSADDEIAVWVNGERVLNVAGSHGYEADKNETPVKLRAGLNQLLVKIGNKGGSWAFHARMPGFDGGKFVKSKEPAPEEKQRAFALATKPDGAWQNPGDAARGAKLFHDKNAAMGGICATCHAVKGKGGAIGPDLTAIGTNYRRPELIVSILEPAKTIALGFEQVMIETKAGETVVGALRQETGEAFTVMGADGATRTIAKADVKTKTDMHTSLMPPGLTMSLKPADFVDLLAYLESLRGQ